MSDISTTAWRAINTTLGIVALASTTLRIYHRCHKHHLWWDDYWAILSQLGNIISGVVAWFLGDYKHPHTSIEQRIIIFWLSVLSFPLVVWLARISIAMSIARLTPKAGMRRFLYFLSACFGLVLAALLFQRIIVCSRSPAWQHNQTTYCYLGRPIAIVTLCTDIPADTFLIVIPLHMLWRMNLSRPHRFLLLVVFSASVLNSILGIVYSIFVLRAQSHHIAWTMLTGLMANIKATVTLFVCNLLVVATRIYCFFSRDGEEAAEPSDTQSRPTSGFSTLTHTNDFIKIRLTDHTPRASTISVNPHGRSLSCVEVNLTVENKMASGIASHQS